MTGPTLPGFTPFDSTPKPDVNPAAGDLPVLRIAQDAILINQAAWEALGQPHRVAWHLDRPGRHLAVTPAGEGDGYSIRRHSANTMLASARSLVRTELLPFSDRWYPTAQLENTTVPHLVVHLPTWEPKAQ